MNRLVSFGSHETPDLLARKSPRRFRRDSESLRRYGGHDWPKYGYFGFFDPQPPTIRRLTRYDFEPGTV